MRKCNLPLCLDVEGNLILVNNTRTTPLSLKTLITFNLSSVFLIFLNAVLGSTSENLWFLCRAQAVEVWPCFLRCLQPRDYKSFLAEDAGEGLNSEQGGKMESVCRYLWFLVRVACIPSQFTMMCVWREQRMSLMVLISETVIVITKQ